LPRLIAECAAQWSLQLGTPFDAHISYVTPATLPNGGSAVLKINFPEEESEREADGLEHWDGDGAARLLAQDPTRRALLLERLEPGTQLWAMADEEKANSIAARVLRRLWRPPPGNHRFRLLSEMAARWERTIPERWERQGKPFEVELLEWMKIDPRPKEQFVLHQDFHGGNVLLSERDWLAIDPKPLVGEREFDTASLVRDRRPELMKDEDAPARIGRRLDQLSAELGLDRERMRHWAIVHTIAWGIDDGYYDEEHIACARWLADA
jgi:streptomycin 6-kinase